MNNPRIEFLRNERSLVLATSDTLIFFDVNVGKRSLKVREIKMSEIMNYPKNIKAKQMNGASQPVPNRSKNS